jgi:hypothetical protein
MSGSPRMDSPVFPDFTRRLSDPKSILYCITELPQQQQTFLYSPSTSSSASLSPPLPQETFSSCLGLPKLGYEEFYNNNNAENLNEGWDICSVAELGDVTSTPGYIPPVIPEEEPRNSFGLVNNVPINSHWSEYEQSERESSKPVRKNVVSWKERGSRERRNIRKCIRSVACRFGWHVRR